MPGERPKRKLPTALPISERTRLSALMTANLSRLGYVDGLACALSTVVELARRGRLQREVVIDALEQAWDDA